MIQRRLGRKCFGQMEPNSSTLASPQPAVEEEKCHVWPNEKRLKRVKYGGGKFGFEIVFLLRLQNDLTTLRGWTPFHSGVERQQVEVGIFVPCGLLYVEVLPGGPERMLD